MKVYQGHIVDVIRHEIFDGKVVVDEGRIKQVKRCALSKDKNNWPYLMPGFIDSHVHIESSMMVPCEFAHVAVSHGTIGVVAYRCMLLCEMARKAGCQMRAPFITLSFLCLPVIPELKITDKHLWDSLNMKVVE